MTTAVLGHCHLAKSYTLYMYNIHVKLGMCINCNRHGCVVIDQEMACFSLAMVNMLKNAKTGGRERERERERGRNSQDERLRFNHQPRRNRCTVVVAYTYLH